MRFGFLSVEKLTGNNFFNGKFIYVDSLYNMKTILNIKGSILSGTVSATFSQGITSTNGLIDGLCKAEVREGRIVNATILNNAIVDKVTTSGESVLSGQIQLGGELRRGHLVSAVSFSGEVVNGLTESGSRVHGSMEDAMI